MQSKPLFQRIKNILAIITLGLLSLFLILILLIIFGIYTPPSGFSNTERVTAVGRTEEFIIPDTVAFSTSIFAQSPAPEAAMAEALVAVGEIKRFLTSIGVAENDIVLPVYDTNVSVDERYPSSVSGNLNFVLRDVSKYDQVVREIGKIRNVSSVNAQMENAETLAKNVPVVLKERLQEASLSDAKIQAESMAKPLNGKVGRIVHFNNDLAVNTYRKPVPGERPDLTNTALRIGYFVSMETTAVYEIELQK